MEQHKVPMDRMISAPDSNEYVNALSHLLGAILSVSATAILVTLAARDGKWAHLVGFAVYGTTLLLSFLASCILHFFLLFGRYKRVLGILDHCAIYLLIAGTYTPFCLTLFGGAIGWLLFGVVWSLAVFWIVVKAVFFVRMSSLVSNLSYISLGWIVLFFIYPMYTKLGAGAIGLMIAAGLVYTLGAVSFQYGRPNPLPPYFGNHELWHLAVLIGSGLFFCVMLLYVLPYPR
ncbi:MAG TPA: hemolysin III family protein [Herpetosiphonaceae bacterium]